MILLRRNRLDRGAGAHSFVMVRRCEAVRTWEPLEIPKVQIAERGKADGSCPAARIAAEEVKREAAAATHFETLAAVEARGSNELSHVHAHRRGSQARRRSALQPSAAPVSPDYARRALRSPHARNAAQSRLSAIQRVTAILLRPLARTRKTRLPSNSTMSVGSRR